MSKTFSLTTLGCAKNQVDSDKLATLLERDGLTEVASASEADVVVVNTCAFIDVAREESVETILSLAGVKRHDAKLVVTGCLAERYGEELAKELPEADVVAGFGVDFTHELRSESSTVPLGTTITRRRKSREHIEKIYEMDLLNLPRRRGAAPWAYVKAAEGCDKKCGFCAIPSFRGPQVSRETSSIIDEVRSMELSEVVLVAQDLANYGRDLADRPTLASLYREVQGVVPWVRLLYLYPSELTRELIELVAASPVPYFDLSLQHVSRDHLRRMRRFGHGDLFLRRIEEIRTLNPAATFRSNFILGYPGETDDDQEALLSFLEAAELDWVGFFAYSDEEGTYAYGRDDHVPHERAIERLNEASELQERITRYRRDALVGEKLTVLVDERGIARSFREAPEIDGLVRVPDRFTPGSFVDVVVDRVEGPDLVATSLD